MKAVNKNATEQAQALLDYLWKTAGEKIITGQHTQTKKMQELTHLKQLTGKQPLLVGFELLSCSGNINYTDASEACLTEVYENRGTVDTAISWAKREKGIVTLCFHWFSPIGGRDKSFYTEHTDFDARRVLEEGTAERKAFFRDMDIISEELRKFQKEKIPVLWRPFHESEGKWFWWGAKGPETACALYKLMYQYYTEELHLDHLLWVWNCNLKEGYPGDDFVDVVSVDIYLEKYAPTDYKREYEKLLAGTTKNKVAALAEVGYIPDVEMLAKSRVPWAYYMTWSQDFCLGEKYNTAENVRAMYESDYAVTGETTE